MTIEERITLVRQSLRKLVTRLTDHGYLFDRPDEVLPGPEHNRTAAIERIEHEIGCLPHALKYFWHEIGSVDLCGSHPKWHGCEYPDPLVVFPPSFAIHELGEFLADKEERLRHNFPYLVPIAPDYYHKAGVSGGMWYNVAVPAVSDDPPLNDEWQNTTFVGYLESAMQSAGFPGLVKCPGHSWPVNDLIQDIRNES